MRCVLTYHVAADTAFDDELFAEIRSNVMRTLCTLGIRVQKVAVEPSKVTVTLEEHAESKLYEPATFDAFNDVGLHLTVHREAKARRTLHVRGVDSFVVDNLGRLMEDDYPKEAILDSYHDPRTGLLKLTLASAAKAREIAATGLRLGCFRYPPEVITMPPFVRLRECWTCYQLEPDHTQAACPFKGQTLCSTCGGKDHRYNSCPNRNATPTCLVCDRTPKARNVHHPTRTMKCPIRHTLITQAQAKAEKAELAGKVRPPAGSLPPATPYAPGGASYSSVVKGTADRQPAPLHTPAPPPPKGPPKGAKGKEKRPALLPTPGAPAPPAAPPSGAGAVLPPGAPPLLPTPPAGPAAQPQPALVAGLYQATRVAGAALYYGATVDVAQPGLFNQAVQATYVANGETPIMFPQLLPSSTLLQVLHSIGAQLPVQQQHQQHLPQQQQQPPQQQQQLSRLQRKRRRRAQRLRERRLQQQQQQQQPQQQQQL